MEGVVDIKNESGSSLEDVLYFRLIKLIYSIKDISETIVELIINIILFLMVLFKWVFQFNTYIASLFKFILNITSRISASITFENKIYILVGTILIYLLIRITNKLNEKIKLLKRKYNNNWSIVINQIIYVFSPYIIFILCVYLPLCVIIPEYYFENLIVKIWILWIPMNKTIISLYHSLLLNIDFNKNIRENDKKYIDKFIYICKKFSNTDIVLNFLEYISNGINYNKNTNLSLLNSKNFSSSKIVNVKALQCWGDYFGLWLTYSFLKSYIIGDGVNAILKLALSHIKVMKIILINVIKKLIFKQVKIIKYVCKIKYISIVIKKLNNLMIFPIYLFKTLNILVVNLNWKCLIISIIVLNILLQIKYHEIYDCKFSMLVESELKCNGNNTQDEESGDDMDEYRNGYEEDHNSSSLIIYEYPSLILIIRNYMINIIDCFTVHIFGITLFGHIHQLNETSNKTSNNSSIYIEKLNRKEYTRSIPLIRKHSDSDDNRKSSRALLLHSKTMPELNIGDKNTSISKLKIIASIIENNILLNWLPDGIKKYYLNIGEKLMGKSNKFKYWILFIIVFVCQIPQWIILLFPPFIVNVIGCMLFGFLYPLIMILKINCSIYDNSKIFDKKLTQKIQTWTIYLLTFNLINEILNIFHFNNNILTWIPFKSHFYYLMILTLQLISSLIPVIIEQNI